MKKQKKKFFFIYLLKLIKSMKVFRKERTDTHTHKLDTKIMIIIIMKVVKLKRLIFFDVPKK